MEDGAPGSFDAYRQQELAAMAAGLPEPHRPTLIGYYVTVASVAGLDAALIGLDEASVGSGSAKKIVAVALPSVTLADCAVLRKAATAGSYRGFPFVLLSIGMVDAKLAAKDAVVEARRFLERECADLTARTGARVVRHVFTKVPESARDVRALAAKYEWSNKVEKLRQEVHEFTEYIGDRLQSGGCAPGRNLKMAYGFW